jgi:hypothetical protein
VVERKSAEMSAYTRSVKKKEDVDHTKNVRSDSDLSPGIGSV